MSDLNLLKNISNLIRYDILNSTTKAGTGHPTSSMSAVELMAVLFFDGFYRYDLKNPSSLSNDRFILSKGHASPLLYSLYHAAGVVSDKELLTLREFNSVLEGHPTPRFKYVDITTGSLGQGLSVGVGEALGLKLKNKDSKTPMVYVLMGDSEMAEGQVWEAMEVASHYKLNNLVAIADINRLGQRGETMLGWDIETYAKRVESFGWNTIILADGHNIESVSRAYQEAIEEKNKPTMIIAKTIKGKGVSFLENKDNWHGKPVPKDRLDEALKELGKIDLKIRGVIQKPSRSGVENGGLPTARTEFNSGALAGGNSRQAPIVNEMISTREAYGDALAELGKTNDAIVVLDGETSNSTYAEKFKKTDPSRFFEMYIAEQNMVSAALGFSKVGFTPFASSFAAFLSRAFDQIRMSQYSKPNLKIVGSHAGVSIGPDGPSQMALEDISMMRSVLDSVVFYPSDGVSTAKLTEIMANTDGLFYLRTTREKTPVLYEDSEEFTIGGSKILRQSKKDVAVIFTAGITVHEALKACEALKKEGVFVSVVDLYSVKPLDDKTIISLAQKTKNVLVVEDHYPYGGIGDAVSSVLMNNKTTIKLNSFKHLAVHKIPRSGKPEELFKYEDIDAEAIKRTILQIK